MRGFKWLLAILVILAFFVSDVYASIVLKVLVVNPSETQKRTIPFKAYLPKEVKPEDIIAVSYTHLTLPTN